MSSRELSLFESNLYVFLSGSILLLADTEMIVYNSAIGNPADVLYTKYNTSNTVMDNIYLTKYFSYECGCFNSNDTSLPANNYIRYYCRLH